MQSVTANIDKPARRRKSLMVASGADPLVNQACASQRGDQDEQCQENGPNPSTQPSSTPPSMLGGGRFA
jgi:hypothetical protein